MWVSVVRGWYRCLHVSPLGCMRSNLEAKVPDPYKRGNLPVLVKPGRIVPQLVNQHGFTSPYDLNKHKTTESYAGLSLLEERLGGRRSECAQIRVSREEDHENIRIRCKLACVPSICV